MVVEEPTYFLAEHVFKDHGLQGKCGVSATNDFAFFAVSVGDDQAPCAGCERAFVCGVVVPTSVRPIGMDEDGMRIDVLERMLKTEVCVCATLCGISGVVLPLSPFCFLHCTRAHHRVERDWSHT